MIIKYKVENLTSNCQWKIEPPEISKNVKQIISLSSETPLPEDFKECNVDAKAQWRKTKNVIQNFLMRTIDSQLHYCVYKDDTVYKTYDLLISSTQGFIPFRRHVTLAKLRNFCIVLNSTTKVIENLEPHKYLILLSMFPQDLRHVRETSHA